MKPKKKRFWKIRATLVSIQGSKIITTHFFGFQNILPKHFKTLDWKLLLFIIVLSVTNQILKLSISLFNLLKLSAENCTIFNTLSLKLYASLCKTFKIFQSKNCVKLNALYFTLLLASSKKWGYIILKNSVSLATVLDCAIYNVSK